MMSMVTYCCVILLHGEDRLAVVYGVVYSEGRLVMVCCDVLWWGVGRLD